MHILGPYLLQFAWGLVILISFMGWGRVVHLAVAGPKAMAPDWGVAAGWGMALALFVGGVLSLSGFVSTFTVILFVATGALIWARNWQPPGKVSKRTWILVAVLAVPLIVRYAAAVHTQALSCSDDGVAYFTFIARLLETGTLDDPFSLRRLAAYGGQTFLQALNVVLGDMNNAFLVDRGVSVIIAFGLLHGFFMRRGEAGPLGAVLSLLLAVLLPFPMVNSASHITGLVMFLTLFRTLDMWPPGDDRAARRYLWVIAGLVAGAASLRVHYLAAAALTVIIYFTVVMAADSQLRVRAGAALLKVGVISGLLMAPWAILLWTSSGTPLFPLWPGTLRPGFEALSADLSASEHLSFFMDVMADPGIVLYALPVVLYVFRRPSPAGLALYGAALVTTAAVAWVFTYSDAENIHRYAAPFLYAAFMATTVAFVDAVRGGLAEDTSTRTVRRMSDFVLCGAVLFLMPVMVSQDAVRLADRWDKTIISDRRAGDYTRMQWAVPAGAGLFTVVSQPFALDHGRNRIANVDVPGAASPDPGLPYFKGATAVKRYLKDLGFTYVAFRDFGQPGECLYVRQKWLALRRGSGREARNLAPYYLDLMDNLDALAAAQTPHYRADGFTVLSLN